MQPTRRSYSRSFKAQVIQECAQPGTSIASVALSHSLNANLVHKWIRVQVQKSTALQPASSQCLLGQKILQCGIYLTR
ncbi:transposase [Pseudomonas helleri]|uniref:transposase n=1 Tax=Pseudomonas helleri TaxID=1608996 RepID=UPI00380B3D36